jgi:hypothetical protein
MGVKSSGVVFLYKNTKYKVRPNNKSETGILINVYEERLKLNFDVNILLNESFEVAKCHMPKIMKTNNTNRYSIIKPHKILNPIILKRFLKIKEKLKIKFFYFGIGLKSFAYHAGYRT